MTDEHSAHSEKAWKAWLVPAGIAGAIIAWCMMQMVVIGNPPRRWMYTNLPYVPGEGYLSTERPGPGPAPAQVVPPPKLPGGTR